MRERVNPVGRGLVTVIGIVIAVAIGWWVFIDYAGDLTDIVGVLLLVAIVILAARIAGNAAAQAFPEYNVAEVAVEGPITRDGGGLPTRPGGATADDVVEQIELADDDRHASALLVKLNTPGGEVVPSDDIRRAAAAFEGPTIAYATDTCASGGYWIAGGCDELWARDASIVGSIGVRWGLLTAKDLADDLGVSYEGFSQGKYKDAGMPLEDLTDDERTYFRGLAADFYDLFVETVSEDRDLDADEVRDTEARVYLGEEAHELGLVDHLGTRDDVEDSLADELGEPVRVREFTPEIGLAERIRGGVTAAAFAVGAGAAAAVTGRDHGVEFR